MTRSTTGRNSITRTQASVVARRLLALAFPLVVAMTGQAMAQADRSAAIGPCSPIAGPDGDISPELPGCRRLTRPQPGSLDDELAFRRRDAGGWNGATRHRGVRRDLDLDE